MSIPPVQEGTAEILAEAHRLLDTSREGGWPLRLLGGVAIAAICPAAHTPRLRRPYGDIDLVARSSDRATITKSFTAMHLAPDVGFNAVNGFDRLWFWKEDEDLKIEVFLDRLSMCHTLELGDRLELHDVTLPPADLLLLKLQVVEMTEKDLKDVVALLCGHRAEPGGAIDTERVASVLATDWGWWRTVTGSLEAVESFASTLDQIPGLREVPERIAAIRAAIDEKPKSRRWKLRARLGERTRWYDTPEEVED